MDSDSDCCIIEPPLKRKKNVIPREEPEAENETENRESNVTNIGNNTRPMTMRVKKMIGDGHCIVHCFAEQFDESKDSVLDRVKREITDKMDVYETYSDLKPDKINQELSDYIELNAYNSDTVDLILWALANIYKSDY